MVYFSKEEGVIGGNGIDQVVEFRTSRVLFDVFAIRFV